MEIGKTQINADKRADKRDIQGMGENFPCDRARYVGQRPHALFAGIAEAIAGKA